LSEFQGTDRFRLRRRLGAGTSGEVFEAFDEERRAIVALKVLRQVDAAAIYRFKKEFRSLSDVTHPNLVQLYELLSDGDSWFFTMELVTGVTLLEHVRSGSGAEDASGSPEAHEDHEAPTLIRRVEEAELASSTAPPPTADPASPERLRTAMAQLAAGLNALHGAGKLHCDLKPSNVLVTAQGRVVLLDFGLVRDILGHRIDESLDRDIVGTPAYMSPEQAAGHIATPASDWYGVGAMLYEALAGQLPFQGDLLRILTDKQKLDPPPPSNLGLDVPEDLDTLCSALLHRNPEERPSGEEVLRWLGEPVSSLLDGDSPGTGSSSTAPPFFGRKEHLESLGEAFRDSCDGRTVAVFVHGSSGTGKTALARRFLQDLRFEHDNVIVLAGRCYQREAVPYKALDSLVDSLSRYLRSLPQHEAELLLPYDVLALARLFPVLRRVEAVAGARRRVLEIPDSRELRRRAFHALRELFLRLTDRSPVVLFIDDLHWGDLDSASLLNELLRPPDPPPLLLVASFRSDEAMTSPLLRSLFSSDLAKTATEIRELRLGDLSQEESRQLAERLLASRGPETEEPNQSGSARDRSVGSRSAKDRSSRDRSSKDSSRALLAPMIAREAKGNPFLIDALVRYARGLLRDRDGDQHLEQALAEATLEKALEARIDDLPTEARRLLEIVAVAGQPLELNVAAQAASLGDGIPAALAALRALHLIRLRSGRTGEVLESYHDRIREITLQLIETERLKSHHGALGEALKATSGRADPEALALHFQEAGDPEQAAIFATQAADQAVEALAFDRAARLYRIALDELSPSHKPERLMVKLADALTNAGRGSEAAQAYLVAADDVAPEEALELRRRAAEQLLISGRIDKGLATIRQVLRSIDLDLPGTPRKSLLSLLLRRGRLKLRGLRYKEQAEENISSAELLRIDTCWSVSVGLGLVDIIRGMDFGTRTLLLALESGEPYRIARALALETGYSATGGSKSLRRTQRLVRAAMGLAKRIDHPHALGLTNLTAGIASYLQGHWSQGLERIDHSEEILRERCTGVTWELDTTFIFQLRALLFLGRYGEVRKRLPGLLKEVQERGDLYAETNLRSRVSWVVWLIQDEPGMAAEEVKQAIGRWSQEGFHLQHYWHMTGVAEITLYSGDAAEAWKQLTHLWQGLDSSLLLRIQFTRVEAHHLRARCALAAAVAAGAADPAGKAILKEAEKSLRLLDRERLFWARPLSQLVRAGILSAKQKTEESAKLLETAADGLDGADMALYAAAARSRLGQLRGGPEGQRLIRESDAWMADQAIRRPELMTNILAPGGWTTQGETPS